MFLAGLVVAQFASGLAPQASASRLLYAMGRDSAQPKAVFGRLSEKFHTPVANLVITGIVGLIAIFLDMAPSSAPTCSPSWTAPANTLGVSWLVLGVVVLALITRGFKAAPPKMTAAEKAAVEAAV